ncbi:FliA/WhiG family RNA polymerase sigma factor [Aquibacillus sp. 3ASR75-11]|uniref:FliA/WhiG family RNA polymerase sigma factor n=2 Tax=Terrihalobacillus insolitus TaxID=2950438 RepID=A0A9X3WPJ2_9BACI|nr:FliA/WhiG family RNA polymerase sigma factor [Terrihalobacillus insolitus]MDC3414116.1 FliA/WhiG family RNA polymerase sigma factor [Terrihalobacillus insolitus]MDC3423557.1 FliA/WhiG family RNA polymerase sigma factor [Terrihalobacillus insolitus]
MFQHEEQCWMSWTKDKDQDAANELINKYFYLVSFHVQRISIHLPSNVSKDDLESFGLLGLYDALNKYEPNRQLKFDTYASFRVRGAILDGLRREDWLPRSTREKIKNVDHAYQQLEQELQRKPTSKEVAKRVNMTEHEVEESVKDTLFSKLLSIEEKPTQSDTDYVSGIGYMVPDEKAMEPEQLLTRSETHEELANGIHQLNEKEQLVISLFYKEELTLTEIGQVMGLTTSRISQIHQKAIYKLKAVMEKVGN